MEQHPWELLRSGKGKQSVKMAGDDGAGAGRAQAVPS